MFASDPAFAPQMGGYVVPRPLPRPVRQPAPVATAPKPQPRPAPAPPPQESVPIRTVVVPPPDALGIWVDAEPRVLVPDPAELGITLE